MTARGGVPTYPSRIMEHDRARWGTYPLRITEHGAAGVTYALGFSGFSVPGILRQNILLRKYFTRSKILPE